MAGAYATFAAHGVHCAPRVVTEIIGPDRKALAVPEPECAQVLEPGIADTVTSLLRGVVDGPTHGRTGVKASIGRPVAGKTGTVNESKAAWFIGYTPQLAASVWLGMPDPKPGRTNGTPLPMKRVTINHTYYKQVYGGSIPAPNWRDAMRGALEGVPVEDFSKADASVVDGEKVPVPDVTGQPYDAAKQALIDAGFGVRSGGFVAAGPTPFGITPYTSPRAGRLVTAGTTITVYVSNGRTPPPPSPSPEPVFTQAPPSTAPPPQPTPKPSKKKGRGGP
jgi:membrane peptidoglycan carboxypeptidase